MKRCGPAPFQSFVPHNLAGEGPRGGRPVEIAWPQNATAALRDIPDQSAAKLLQIYATATEVIDFVPTKIL